MDWASDSKSFTRERIFDPAQLTLFGSALCCLVLCLVLRARSRDDARQTPNDSSAKQLEAGIVSGQPMPDPAEVGYDPEEHRYDAHKAWVSAGAFFSVCFVISWATGVLDATFFHPTWPNSVDNSFIVFTAASFATVVIGYWIIWPIGTVGYGRRWGWHCVLFGLVDGLAESMLFLCIWSVVELLALPRWGVGLITFFLQGGFKANWDQKYWNIYVAPAHNIEEWNKWKVLFVHIPNVFVTFSYFITFGNATLYCATQTLALVGSTSFMRFPSPSSKYTNPPLRSQVETICEQASLTRLYSGSTIFFFNPGGKYPGCWERASPFWEADVPIWEGDVPV
ncbi:hypothetical protein TrRE_jg8856 [Triparma retinervis]|uniref:Uncharacterized protein n=1 Tax=Triparma retinervis TaxID=2557542 RepID=A0A9W7A7V5_9STRA|nr:hypothetical protein TrRE_jg8856 [Triparma retinervis]